MTAFLLACATMAAAALPPEGPLPLHAVSDEEAPPPPPGDPDGARITRLQETLYALVHGPVLGRTRVGFKVIETRTGRVLYQRRDRNLMDPASNQKLLATATALLRLGADYRFRTELHGAPAGSGGVLSGDLILRGSGDPSLRHEHLTEMARALVRKGIRRITGNVVADRASVFSDKAATGARTPLEVTGATFFVRVRPGPRARARAHVFVEPLSEAMIIRNQANTVPRGRTRITVTLGAEGDRIVVHVRGRISMRHPGVVLRKRPRFSMLMAASILHAELGRQGITLDGKPVLMPVSAPSPKLAPLLLAVHESVPLYELARPINKISNNDYADRLLEALGAESTTGLAGMGNGLRALRAAMAEAGLPDDAYVPRNGSGLGHGNRITADAITNLLMQLYRDPRIGPEMLQSLSVGGVDGTTRNRFLHSPAAQVVRAKTGTLNGKSALSGFVGNGDEVLAFSILVERIGRRALPAVRTAQVRIVEALWRYAQGFQGDTPPEEVEPGRDFESGEIEEEGPTVLPQDSGETPAPHDDAELDQTEDVGTGDAEGQGGDTLEQVEGDESQPAGGPAAIPSFAIPSLRRSGT